MTRRRRRCRGATGDPVGRMRHMGAATSSASMRPSRPPDASHAQPPADRCRTRRVRWRRALLCDRLPTTSSKLVGTSLTCALPRPSRRRCARPPSPRSRSGAPASRSASARRRRAARRSARLPAPSPCTCSGFASSFSLRTSSPTMSPSATRSSACCSNIVGLELDVLGLHALLLQVAGHARASAAATRRRPATSAARDSSLRAARASTWSRSERSRPCASARA